MTGIICAWLRNDLRVHDSPVLHRAAQLASETTRPVLPVYILDPRLFSRTRRGTLKTGPFRALFLLQALLVLKKNLRSLGSDLLVRVGKPEAVLPSLLQRSSVLVTQEEVTSEELRLDARVRAALGANVGWEYCWGSTMFHREDLPFPSLQEVPDQFTVFKNMVEPELAAKANEVPDSFQRQPEAANKIKVRPCHPVPEIGSLPLPPLDSAPLDRAGLDFEPSWADLPYTEAVAVPAPPDFAVLRFEGGEDAALDRLKYYLWDTNLVDHYFDTRNGMLGGNYSTKFAPWLALGCLSARKIFEQLREYEKSRGSNKSIYWVLFHLTCRDFFRFFSAKHGNRIFLENGVDGRLRPWRSDPRLFELWAEGRTGFPLVDANMRELKATGFMSNRGRQNVASFLALDLQLDWRQGADWFESYLIDYDVASNWGNWVAAAGLTSGRLNHFNILRQAKTYDASGDYVRRWVPELREVGADKVHTPWLLSEEEKRRLGAQDYPGPCIDPSVFKDIDIGQGRNGRGKSRSSGSAA